MLERIREKWELRYWFVIKMLNRFRQVRSDLRIWYLGRRGFSVIRLHSDDTERFSRLVTASSRLVHSDGTVNRVVIIIAPKEEVIEWMQQNMTGHCEYLSHGTSSVIFIIRKPEDAVAFKMRWW